MVKLSYQETQPESFDEEPIVYTDEELEAMRQVRTTLLEEHGIEESRISPIFLAIATINGKLKVQETASKLEKLLRIMEDLQCGDGIPQQAWQPDAAHELQPYPPCGKDFNGASTFWIAGGKKVPKEQERHHVHAAIMNFLAIHADPISLRQGVTFCIDVSKAPKGPNMGNEKTLQKFYQAFPQRPQSILIAGTNPFTRVLVNASIKLASLFTKQKVLDRIQFVSVEQAVAKVPLLSAPVYAGSRLGQGTYRANSRTRSLECQYLVLLPLEALWLFQKQSVGKLWAVGTFEDEANRVVAC